MSDLSVIRLLAELVPEGSRVLDLGCGDGALLDYLQRHRGCSGYGVELDDRTDGGLGALIRDVSPDSPAEAARLADGDIVIAVDGATIEGVAGLIAAVRDLEPGDTTVITVRRNGVETDITAVLAARPTS